MPINLTHGWGRLHDIRFRIAMNYVEGVPFRIDSEVLVAGFNTKTKENGFYQIKIGVEKKPTLLTTGPYSYYHEPHQIAGS